MKNKKLIIPALIFMMSGFANAAERYIDPIQKKIDEQHKPLIEKYKKTCKAKNRVSCQIEAAERADEAVPNRGSIAYNKATYSGLSVQDSKARLRQLINLYDRVNGQSSGSWDGKMSKERYESEIRWIMSKNLGQSAPDIYSAKQYLDIPLK